MGVASRGCGIVGCSPTECEGGGDGGGVGWGVETRGVAGAESEL